MPTTNPPLCPLCHTPMVTRHGRSSDFWGCVKFPSCKGTRSLEGEPTLSYRERLDDLDRRMASMEQRLQNLEDNIYDLVNDNDETEPQDPSPFDEIPQSEE
jgi:ssDNA-binding Zn-finger/Zn-ribbon topoisomerase 1